MSAILEAASWVFLVAGSFLIVVGGIGMLRLPDFYCRIHAAGITDTLGAWLILGAATDLALKSGVMSVPPSVMLRRHGRLGAVAKVVRSSTCPFQSLRVLRVVWKAGNVCFPQVTNWVSVSVPSITRLMITGCLKTPDFN